MLIDGVGLWCEIAGGNFVGRAAVFLDRDGVVVEEVTYLGRVEDLRMLPGAAAAISRCNQLGIPVVLATNQSGIGRGYYDWTAFCAVQSAISAALALEGAHFDAVLACAYHAEAEGSYRIADHPWRKPNPGMIRAAAERMQLDLARSWIIGDRANDLAAGQAASLRGGVLVTSGRGKHEQSEALALADQHFMIKLSPTLADAVSAPIACGLAGRRG